MECIIRSEYCRRLASSYHHEGPSEYHFTGPPIGSPASLPSSNATQHPPSSRQSFGSVIRARMVVSYRSTYHRKHDPTCFKPHTPTCLQRSCIYSSGHEEVCSGHWAWS